MSLRGKSDSLATEIRTNASGTLPVACECGWDDGGTLVMVDVWRREFPPIPYVRIIEYDGRAAEHEPPARGHHECSECGAELDDETVVRR